MYEPCILVSSYNREINDLSLKSKKQDYKVWIFDGKTKNPVEIANTKREFQEHKAILGSKLKILTKKRAIIAQHLEQVMEIFDISKTKRLMAEGQRDKNIADNIYRISKEIAKELSEFFQMIDNEFRILIDEILSWNMPVIFSLDFT